MATQPLCRHRRYLRHEVLAAAISFLNTWRRYNRHMAVQFTFDQAVRTMGVTPERLEKLIDEGKIRANRGVQTTLDREAVLEYMNKVGHEAVLERIERAKPASQRAKK